jgi:hypothetical protein
MTNILLGLAASVALAGSLSTAPDSSTGGTHPKPPPPTSSAHKVPGGATHLNAGAHATYLSSQECTTLGGKVTTDMTCNGPNKRCTIEVYDHVGASVQTKTLCLTAN